MKRFLICILVTSWFFAGVAIFADENLPTDPRTGGGPNLELLKPAGELLSGRAWLMVEGLDPGVKTKPGWDPLTKLERGTLDGNGLGSGGGTDSS